MFFFPKMLAALKSNIDTVPLNDAMFEAGGTFVQIKHHFWIFLVSSRLLFAGGHTLENSRKFP